MRVESAQVVAVPKLPKLSRHGCAKNSGGIEEAAQKSPARLDISWKCEQSKPVFQKWEAKCWISDRGSTFSCGPWLPKPFQVVDCFSETSSKVSFHKGTVYFKAYLPLRLSMQSIHI